MLQGQAFDVWMAHVMPLCDPLDQPLPVIRPLAFKCILYTAWTSINVLSTDGPPDYDISVLMIWEHLVR